MFHSAQFSASQREQISVSKILTAQQLRRNTMCHYPYWSAAGRLRFFGHTYSDRRSWRVLTRCSRTLFSFLLADAQPRRWNDVVRFTLSPGLGRFHGAAGHRCADTEERALGSKNLRRASNGKDCDSDGSQHRSVSLHLFPCSRWPHLFIHSCKGTLNCKTM